VQNWRILLREREGETRVPSAGVPAVAAATNLVVVGAGAWENPVRLAGGSRTGPNSHRRAPP